MRNLKKYVQTHLQNELDIIRGSDRANVLPELSFEKKAIIYRYTDTGHFGVNEALRDSSGKKVTEFSKHLDDCLSKLPNYEGLVFRGMKFTPSRLQQYRHAFETDTPIIEHAFMSTSISPKIARQFGFDVLLEILSKKGKLIENVSKFGLYLGTNEQEVLFRKGSIFNVLDIEESINHIRIFLEEIE
jgi:ADP-ribosyltransferase exoenzyme